MHALENETCISRISHTINNCSLQYNERITKDMLFLSCRYTKITIIAQMKK